MSIELKKKKKKIGSIYLLGQFEKKRKKKKQHNHVVIEQLSALVIKPWRIQVNHEICLLIKLVGMQYRQCNRCNEMF